MAGEAHNLGLLFENSCGLFENNILFPATGDDESSLTYGETLKLARQIAVGMRRQGFGPGKRALFLARPSPDFFIALIAVHLCGGIDVHCDPELLPAKMAVLAARAECRFCLADTNRSLLEIRHTYPDCRTILLSRHPVRPARKNCISLHDLMGAGRNTGFFPFHSGGTPGGDRLLDDPASILFEGSAGEPDLSRGIVLTHRGIMSNIDSMARRIPTTELDTILATDPIIHPQGRFAFYFAIWHGCPLLFSAPADVEKELHRFAPTILIASTPVAEGLFVSFRNGYRDESRPRSMLRLLHLRLSRPAEWSRAHLDKRLPRFGESGILRRLALDLYALMAALVTFPLLLPGRALFLKQAAERWGGRLRVLITGDDNSLTEEAEFFFVSTDVSVVEAYWMGCCSMAVACRVLEYTGQRERLITGTVGTLLPDTELRLIDNRGEDVTGLPGAEGLIYIRGPQVMQGYYHNPATTAEVLDRDGWLRTGDTGRLTLDGELQLVGRWGRR